jgi:hypothetical protein
VILFSGKKKSWTAWEEKSLVAKANKGGYYDILVQK